MRDVYIHSAACLAHDPVEDFADVKRELEQSSGKKFRRVNRFIVLALASAYRLPDIAHADSETSLYLGTKHGCATDSFGMLTQMYRDELIPLPFTFINTSANMAGFYVAQTLGLSGENYTFSQPWGSFEKAFSLAYRDIGSGRNEAALAGSCDEAVFPLEEARRSMKMADDETLLEGGCWMHLSSRFEGSLAKINRLGSVSSLAEAEEAYPSFKTDENTAVVIDATLNPESFRVESNTAEVIWLAEEKERVIGSAGGKLLVSLLSDHRYKGILYLCREGLERYTFWMIEKY